MPITSSGRWHFRVHHLTLCVLLLWSGTPALSATFNHPSGLAFVYPDSWTVQLLEANVLLTTPNLEKDANGTPKEFVLLGAESLAGVTDLLHTDVIEFFDNGAAQLLPGASRSTAPAAQDDQVSLKYAAPDGAVLTVRYRFQNNLGLYVAHRHPGSSQHDQAVAAIFVGYQAELKLDPQLLGAWYRSSGSMTDVDYSSDGGASYVSTNSSHRYVFDSDFGVRYGSSASVYGQASGGGSGVAVSSSGDNEDDLGTYTITADTLTILWAEGEAVNHTYSVFETSSGPALKLVTDGGKPRYYRKE